MQASAYHNQLSAVFCGACLSFALMPGSSDSLTPWERLCMGLVMAFAVLLFTAVSCLIYEGLNLPRWIKGLLLLLLCCGWKPVSAFMEIWRCSLAWDWTDVWELVTGSVMLCCWPAVGAIVAWRIGSGKRWFSLLCIIAGILLLLYGLSPEPDGVDWDRMG